MVVFMVVVVAVVVAAVGGAVIWFVKGQNNLVGAEELCGNALSLIGVQQTSRWDALNTLADLTKSYSDQEYKTLMETIHARQGIDTKSSAAQVEQQEGMITQGLGRVMALAEAYPELKSNTVYLKTMDEVKNYEDKVRMSRMVYNDTVTKYNRLVRSLPGALLAGSMGFEPREYLQDDPAKGSMPNLAR